MLRIVFNFTRKFSESSKLFFKISFLSALEVKDETTVVVNNLCCYFSLLGEERTREG